MKRIILIIFICILSNSVWSQNRFNVIVEDTISHIPNSIIATDTGYIMLTGTDNEYGVRCFSLIYIDNNGNKLLKKVYGDSYNEYWEGHNNNLKAKGNYLYFSGSYNHMTNNTKGIHLSIFNDNLEMIEQSIICDDTIWKKAFNTLQSSSKDFYSVGQIDNSELEDAYLLLVKMDSNLNFCWQKEYGQRYEYGEQIIETSDSNILIGGGTFSFPTGVTDEDWYLIKVDTAGNVIWEDGFGRPGFLNYDGPVKGLIETSDSNYVACGGYPAFKSATDTYWDGCLRKISKDGELMWEKQYRSYSKLANPDTDFFENTVSSLLLKNGEVIVLGNWRSEVGRSRGYLQKITDNGEICWNREYYAIDYSSNNLGLIALQNTPDNGFILAGYGNEFDTHGYSPAQQAWLVKTDSLGLDGLCNSEIPELNFDIEFPTMLCRNDTMQVYVYIAGKSAPYTIEFSTGQVVDSIYYPALFVPIEIGLSTAEVEYGGEIIYSQEITEATLSNHEWGQCIAKPIEFHTPQFQGTYNVDITITDAYGESKTITKSIHVVYCDDAIESESVCPVKLYPNPAKDKVYLDIPEAMAAETAEIYNSAGQLIKSVSVHKGLNAVDVSDFASGNYILKITTDNESYSLSFDKE